jgi:hypothetical protein
MTHNSKNGFFDGKNSFTIKRGLAKKGECKFFHLSSFPFEKATFGGEAGNAAFFARKK